LQALQQIIDQNGTVNLNRLKLETAGTVEEALATAKISGIPNLNFLVADTAGKIGWTIMGPIAHRNRLRWTIGRFLVGRFLSMG